MKHDYFNEFREWFEDETWSNRPVSGRLPSNGQVDATGGRLPSGVQPDAEFKMDLKDWVERDLVDG